MSATDEPTERQKQVAILRSLADQVASPVVAGRKSHRTLSNDEKKQWKKIVDVIVAIPQTTAASVEMFSNLGQSDQVQATNLARTWQAMARTQKIGYSKWPIVGFLPIPGFWVFFFKLLIQLALMYLESQRQNESRVSDR